MRNKRQSYLLIVDLARRLPPCISFTLENVFSKWMLLGLLQAINVRVLGQSPNHHHDAEPVLGRGVVVTYVLAETAGERAGIKPGDILLTWTRGNAKG